MIAEAAIVTKTSISDYMRMNLSLFRDFRKAISNVLGSLSNHQ